MIGVGAEITNGTNGYLAEVKEALARSTTRSIRFGTEGLKEEFRSQTIMVAGLGQRMANTWRGVVYPSSRPSLGAAGLVYSRAPRIISLWMGDVARPVFGGDYLWIPTENVPLAGRNGRRMGPEELEAAMQQKLIVLPGRGGNKQAFMPVQSRSRARAGGRRRRGSRPARKLELMYNLVREVRGLKVFDLASAGQRWAGRAHAEFERDLGLPR